jgi:A/G-specific adenine glycosylase
MLQQTQVASAIPYYQRFLERFPTLPDLARARPDDVLSAWAGLGYYRRARHLHEAARIVVREHGARVPDDPVVFARLPGVGRYTVGAVMSIAFGRPLPVLDGNVARVLSRLLALRVSVRDPRGAR